MQEQNNLNLNYKVPIVAVDGQTVLISTAGPASLIFFQARGQAGPTLEADVVAAVRLHNLDELKNLQKLITDTITQHETREK